MLEIKHLSKNYGHKVALQDIHIPFKNGLYGLLGPNGAGKSTLMNIISDSLTPTTGEVLWNGKSIQKLDKEYRKILGYMPQHQGLYEQFTGRQFLNYMAVLKQIPKEQIHQVIEKAASYVNLTNELHKKIGAYSGGMKQRLLIANTIIGDPKLLIFDEPTAGLDPKERIRMRQLIAKLAVRKIVIVATHIVCDIEEIANQILILKDGLLLENNSAAHLIQKYCPDGRLEDVYMQIFGDCEDV